MQKKSFTFYFFFLILFSLGYFYYKNSWIENSYFIRILTAHLKSIRFSECNISYTKKIFPESILIVGHAYGSSSINSDNFISKKLEKILDENKKNISILFLTGDVFEKANKNKWARLFNKYKDHFEIHIAPGNHDNFLNDILFSFNDQFNKPKISKYPYLKKTKNYNFIIEDSFSKGWQIDKKVLALLAKLDNSKQIFILRHNIANAEFLNLANSKEGLISDLPALQNLTKKIQKKVTIISGDTGASKDLPSYFCKKNRNITVLVNGIGNLKKDNILILKKENIYRYEI